MRSKIKKILIKINFLLTCKIPNLFKLVFISPFIKKEITRNGVKDVKVFRFKYWHLGYMYFKGIYKDNDVFIKYNSDKSIIINEVFNIEFLNKNSSFLGKKIPFLFKHVELRRGAFLVEEFWKYKCLSLCKNNSNVEYDCIYNEFINILKEFQRINFMHLDINDTNFYITDNNDVMFLDLGFSLANKNNFDFINNNRIKKYVINHLNEYSRLEAGYIDDAVSFIVLSSNLYNNFMKDYHKYWLNLNNLSNKLFFENR